MLTLKPIGYVHSPLKSAASAPKQGDEGAPDAWIHFEKEVAAGLRDLRVGDEVLVLTWLHRAERSTLEVHPRDDATAPLKGVFSTRSADRPNPVGIHRATIVDIAPPTHFLMSALEAVDGTPVIDIKPVLDRVHER